MEKGITQSKTFWGILLVFLTTFLEGQGFNISEMTSGTVTSQFLVAAFSGLALYGRATATSKVKGIL